MDNFQRNLHIVKLIEKYIRNELSAAEKTELQTWVDADPQNAEFFHKTLNDALDDQMLNFYAEHHKRHNQDEIAEKPTTWWRRLFFFKSDSGKKGD